MSVTPDREQGLVVVQRAVHENFRLIEEQAAAEPSPPFPRVPAYEQPWARRLNAGSRSPRSRWPALPWVELAWNV